MMEPKRSPLSRSYRLASLTSLLANHSQMDKHSQRRIKCRPRLRPQEQSVMDSMSLPRRSLREGVSLWHSFKAIMFKSARVLHTEFQTHTLLSLYRLLIPNPVRRVAHSNRAYTARRHLRYFLLRMTIA